jgi:hypothetical protein
MRGNSHTRNAHTNKKGPEIPPFFVSTDSKPEETKDRLKTRHFVIPETRESSSSSTF